MHLCNAFIVHPLCARCLGCSDGENSGGNVKHIIKLIINCCDKDPVGEVQGSLDGVTWLV